MTNQIENDHPFGGPLWREMHARPRTSALQMRESDIPGSAGVYACYRDGLPIYVGKAKSLKTRVWKSHMGKGRSMRNSAFRRNVAEHLRIARAQDIYDGNHKCSGEDAFRVNTWVRECEIAWITCRSESEAKSLEDRLKAEDLPLLTKT